MGSNSVMEGQEELLKMLDPLPGRISDLLKAGRITDSHERHYLAFMEMELGAIVASLRMPLPPPGVGFMGITPDPRDRRGVAAQKKWLESVEDEGRHIVRYLCNQHGEEAPRALLREAMRCFRRPRSFDDYEVSWSAYLLYRMRYLELPSSELMPSPPQAAQVDAAAVHDHLVGIDGTANELLGWLMAADESLRVMAIAGPAGIGKTTLAMELHRRLRCQTREYYFQCYVVANFFRRPHRSKLLLQTILKQIIEQLEIPNISEIKMLKADPELLACVISELLEDKRYFALIDDIFDESDWEMIKGAFPNNNCGSRILFTARDQRIAGWCLSNYNGIVHKMKPLIHSDSEKLLHIKAFGSMDDCPPENLNLFCDEILTKCRGIPSFITGMADWLKQHQQQHGSSEIPRVEHVHLLLKQFDYGDELRLSQLYLSMFPQGYVFDKVHLMHKWLDEGFSWLLSDAEESFFELADRNIVTRVAENCGPNLDEDDLCQWQVNPFVLSFLASRAEEKGLVFTSSTLTSLPSSGGNNARIARRLALHHPDPQLPAMLQEIDLSHTRSLLISGAVDRTTVPLDKFAYLVLLDLQGWENLKDEDLLQICKMFMLRYLSVRNTKVSKLPPQIKELRILRALDVSHTNISEIPSEVCELEYLGMLDLRGTPISQLPDQTVGLKQLKHLIVGGAVAGSGMIDTDQTMLTKIPKTIYQLEEQELLTLATIDLSQFSARSVQSLGELWKLEVLAITWSFHQCSDKDYQQALQSSIESWRWLKSLTIHCGLGCSMEFLGSLTEPPYGLENFKVIDGKFASVPRWIRRLEHLTFLQITVCKQVADDVKILAGLVKLQRLVLGLEFIPEKAIVIEKEGFKELERFSLDCHVPWLTFEEEAMPKLTYLRLNLHAYPASEMSVPSGISNLEMLSEVALCYNVRYINSPNVKRTVEAVRKEVADNCNPIPVDFFINGIRVDVNQASDEEAESTTELIEDDVSEDGVVPLRRATLFQSEIEIEGETKCHV